MCTLPRRELVRAYVKFLDTNALDPRVFPSVRELEEEVVEEAGRWFSCPGAAGYVTSGGTEGNLMALWVAREVTGRKKVVAPLSVHYSVKKACSLLGMRLVLTGLGEDYRPIPRSWEEGWTGRRPRWWRRRARPPRPGGSGGGDGGGGGGEGILPARGRLPGGFLLPFLPGRRRWDFEVEGVSSLAADLHKLGGAPIPSGLVLFRRREWLERVEWEVPYLGGRTHTLLGTRPGASVAASWLALKLLDGREARRCVEMARRLAEGIRRVEGARLVAEPELNVVVFTHERLGVRELEGELGRRGWVVSRSDFPEGIRLVVMPHHRPSHLRSFLRDLGEAVEACGGPRGS